MLAILFFASLQSLSAQTTIPTRKAAAFPEFVESDEGYHKYILGHIISLGFSSDGKFAYVIEPADEACGCYFFDFIIQDLNTDKLVFKKHFEIQEDLGEAVTDDWKTIWQKHGALFMAQMAANNIVLKPTEITYFPAKINSNSYSVEIAQTKGPDADMEEWNVVKEAKIWFWKNQAEKKAIATFQYQQGYVLNFKAGGYFKSPYEDRIAVVILREDRGWEGPPNTINPVVIGASLTARFAE